MVSYPFPLPPQKSVGVFRLRYPGLGQRVGPNPVVDSNDPLAEIFDQLETQLVGSDPATILTRLARDFYHPDRNWFIAAHVSFRGFDLRVLFNDPAMYGLELTVANQPVTPLSGLLFEILYQKLGPNLGVYYGALTLPYALRRIPLEGVILILPGFSIWIYTNGDFKVNVGWPLGDSSIGVQVGILIGQGGFCFAKLRSGDDPGAQPSIDYNPILAFGIGLRTSASVSFNASIFSASLSVMVSATLQGVLAWRSGGSVTGPPDHYWFAGTAGLAVLIQGSVDFAILKASVLISFDASAAAAFETGYSTQLAIFASVSVEVSISVLFFTIHLSFSTPIEHTFLIGSGPVASISGPLGPGLAIARPPPARAEPQVLIAARRLLARMPVTEGAGLFRDSRFAAALAGGAATVAVVPPSAPIEVHFVLQPTVAYAAGQAPAINLIATLLMDCPPPHTEPLASPGAATGFEVLVVQIARWLVGFTSQGLPWEERFADLSQMLGMGGAAPGPEFGGFDGFREKLDDFFTASIRLKISGAMPAQHGTTAAILPMLDVLELVYPGASGDTRVDFGNFNPPPADYPQRVDAYFASLGLTTTEKAEVQPAAPSMASFLVGDYFLLLCRQVAANLLTASQAQAAAYSDALVGRATAARLADAGALKLLDLLGQHVTDVTGPAAFEQLLDTYDYAGTAGIVSNFMLRGLQLPLPTVQASMAAEGFYRLTGQQFAVSAGVTLLQASLSPSPSNPPDGCIDLADASPPSATTSITLPSPLPPMPDPVWLHGGSPDPGGAEVIRLALLPQLMAVPLVWSLKDLTAWMAPSEERTVYRLPPPLTGMIATVNGLNLALRPGSAHSPSEPLPARAGLLIRLSITQVAQPSWADIAADGSPALGEAGGGSAVAFLYQLNGTDEATRELIYQALVEGVGGAQLTLLYNPPGADGLRSDARGIARAHQSVDVESGAAGRRGVPADDVQPPVRPAGCRIPERSRGLPPPRVGGQRRAGAGLLPVLPHGGWQGPAR